MSESNIIDLAKDIKECCGTCRYWTRSSEQDSKEGLCRRFPPTFVALPARGVEPGILFPPMADFNWCGEYKRNIRDCN